MKFIIHDRIDKAFPGMPVAMLVRIEARSVFRRLIESIGERRVFGCCVHRLVSVG